MKCIALFALTLAGLAACETPSAPTSRELTVAEPSFGKVLANESVPFGGTLVNPCTPAEDVAFEGRLHVLIKGTPDDFTVHTNGQGIHGVGLISGDRYVLQEHEKSQTQTTGPTATQLFSLRFHMVRQGPEDNFFFRLVLRATFQPDGTVQVEVIDEEVECRG